MENSILIFFGLLLLGATIESSKILVVIPLPGKSHFGAYAPYFEELAKRGHEVTVVSGFPRKTPLANYTDIALPNLIENIAKRDVNLFEIGDANFVLKMVFVSKIFLNNCEQVLQSDKMQKLIKSNDKQFDLVIIEPFFTHCTYGLLHKFNAPVIQILPNTLISWNEDIMGNPSTLSYIPELQMQTLTLDFMGRMKNLVISIYQKAFMALFVRPKMEALMKEYFNDPTLPSLSEIERRVTFHFLHSHPVLNFPRPLTPNTIEVGGLHLKEAKNKLPEDLKKFMDDAPHGVIYFSLGSNVKSVDMPVELRNGLLKAFSKLKQKVLWKWEADSLPGQPSNVRLGKWLPQHEILAHRNLKFFITHGGLMSLQEATFYGVPLVVIPVMADQKFNALHTQHAGYAVMIDVHNITEESMTWAIQEILNEPRYTENAKRVSQIFRDQPQSPMERAIFWTEYAIRHKGAPHLRSAALDLNFIEYHLLDVIAVLAVGALVSLVLFLVIVRILIRRFLLKPSSKKTTKSKKQN